MTHEDKQLLLKDLCMRLPYGVQLRIDGDIFTKIWCVEDHAINGFSIDKFEIKPYLRPMSNMTEEEIAAYLNACDNEMENALAQPRYSGIDWLLPHHFDFHNLIERELAIEVTEENNPYK